MAPYNYNNYHDPVGSQSNSQPQGYTYRANTSSQYPSQANTNYQANYNQSYDNNNYANQQQYSTNTQQGTAAATSTNNRNASNLNSLTQPTYNQNSTSNRSSGNAASSYDTNTYYASAGFAALNDRSQSNNSPLYATNTGASTFGRLSLPDQSQSSSATYGNTQPYQTQATSSNASTQYRNAPSSASSRSYKTAYNQAQNQTQPPQRYASPLHAVQAQQQHHGHNKQPSRSSNPQPSPQMSVQNVQQQDNQYQRQTSASVEPSPTTVDPTQIYDFRAEQQRKAQAEAEKRKKREAERAARMAEEDARKQEEERRVAEEAAKTEEQERLAREKRETEERAKKAEEEAAMKKAAQARKNEQRRKAREEKRQSQTAATALTQMASGSAADAAIAGMPGVGDMSGPPANDEEAEMRAMFKKMREFNARNPDMLAKLWEEERQTHAATSQGSPAQPTPKPAQSATATKKQAAPKTGAATPATRPAKSNAVAAVATPASQAPAQKAAPPAQGGALWPPDKKGSLAEAAAKWLNNLPQNRSLGRSISREQVLKILDGNPAYVQLCESLEAVGIKFGRSDLAQELLKAVPEVRQQKQGPSTINGQATAAAAAANPPLGESQKKKPGRPKKDQPGNYHVGKPSQGNGPVSYLAPVFSLANAAREVNNIDTTSANFGAQSSLASAITASAQGPSDLQSPYCTDAPMVEDDVQPVVDVKDEEKPEEPPKPPADKEEAARKRTFNDLVDLTKDNESDGDEGPPRKIQQSFAGPSNGAVKHQPQQQNGFNKPMTFQQFLNRTQPVQNPAPYHGPYGTHIQQTQPRPLAPPNVLPSNQPRPSGPTEEQKQHERMKGKMLVEPIMRDRVARKSKYDSRTIARDVLLATGRHPDMRPLNAHLSTMQRLLADHGGAIDGTGNKSDLSTIKWDIVDPGEPAEDAKAKAKKAAESREKAMASAGAGDDEAEADDEGEGLSRAQDALRKIRNGEDLGEDDLSNIDDPMVRKQIKNRLKVRQQSEKLREGKGKEPAGKATTLDSEGNYVSVLQQQLQTANPKRRGRPPKSATASARASPVVNNTDTNNDILGSDLTPNKGKGKKVRVSNSSPSMASGSPAVGYAAFRQQTDENGNVIKKKGRPVGWRKHIHSREANGLEAAKSAGATYKASGSRLRQSTGATPMVEKSVQPVYQVYKCKWSDCTAQLDNLERLKKHVVKLHGGQNADNRFECQWQPCPSQGKSVDSNGMIQTSDEDFATFDDIADWMKHVNKAHLDEVAWKQGDGPRGGSVSEIQSDSEAWLSDSKGRSVTPLIVPGSERQHTEDSQPDPTPQKKKLFFLQGPGPFTKEQREAAAELQKLRDKKEREGWIMGQEGSRLVTDKRRRGFLDDEDFEDVIYDSD